MQTQKPYSASCDQNREPILALILPLLKDKKSVLEIGSGTGQHAVYFAKKMPHLTWQTSDQIDYHAGINLWLNDAGLENTPPPIPLDVSHNHWPETSFEVIFSANAVHIMSWQNVIDFMQNAPKLLAQKGLLILYGPFNYAGKYTSDSNKQFDRWLKQQNPQSSIRDFEAINELAEQQGLKLLKDYTMPANNRLLCWLKN